MSKSNSRHSSISKRYDSIDKSYIWEDRIDANMRKDHLRKDIKEPERTRVKCGCCNQTQFFRDEHNLYIKCVRCKTEQKVKLYSIQFLSSELTT